ncbi:hypothetical protein O0I10_003425 [Lichtheimia ornata]|uniref:Uncharacterized protein n=1 Tax=Lichtheimia ornata TaxID=688661 RepID=A0AAD7VA90_9FUNG|nr:uncharacterized protein O0I10_003425 [Lichtheimia ornata]KAJ8660782.1 hypothetical protein O0I10_003425 [Lichtheimia ornata]
MTSTVVGASALWIFISIVATFIIYALQAISFAAAGEQSRGQASHLYLKQEGAYFDHHSTNNLATRLAMGTKDVNEIVTRMPEDTV